MRPLPVLAALAALAALAVAAPAAGATAPPTVTAPTLVQTPVLYDDDEGGSASGDDPAIWVHPERPEDSLVVVTAKDAGLRVYDLDGVEIQSLAAPPAPREGSPVGRFNNVDLARDVELDGDRVDLAVVSDRGLDQVRSFRIDPDGAAATTPLVDVTAPGQPLVFQPGQDGVDTEQTTYGLAVYQPVRGGDRGETFAVVTQEGRTSLATVRLQDTGAGIGYEVSDRLELPASFALSDGSTWTPCEEPGVLPQLEGLAVDVSRDAGVGVLYAAQEDIGFWRIPLPLGRGTPELVDRTRTFGLEAVYDPESEECEPVEDATPRDAGALLEADAEGVDVVPPGGPAGGGYVLVSSQGDDGVVVYERRRGNRPVARLEVSGGVGDEVNGSDGLAVTTSSLPGYPQGLLVLHDEPHTPADSGRDATNFQYVSWADVVAQLPR